MTSLTPLISVIMPIYNVERYLPRAMDSILAQTLDSFEIIAVDDGSTDESGRIADAYAAKDARVRVIHQVNQRAHAARNAGIECARGAYLFFADADDWLEPDALSTLVEIAERDALQLVICGFTIDTYYTADRFVRTARSAPDARFPDQQAFRARAHTLFDFNMLYPPWNKLIRADYIVERGILFPDTFWDDFPFNLAVIREIGRVGVTSKQLYHFTRARAESENTRYRPQMYEKREEEHQWMLELYAHWGIGAPDAMEVIYRRYIERALGCVENIACRDCALPMREKVRAVGEVIAGAEVRKALAIVRPRSAHMRLMLLPVQLNWAWLTFLEGWLLASARRRFARLYAVLKGRR